MLDKWREPMINADIAVTMKLHFVIFFSLEGISDLRTVNMKAMRSIDNNKYIIGNSIITNKVTINSRYKWKR